MKSRNKIVIVQVCYTFRTNYRRRTSKIFGMFYVRNKMSYILQSVVQTNGYSQDQSNATIRSMFKPEIDRLYYLFGLYILILAGTHIFVIGSRGDRVSQFKRCVNLNQHLNQYILYQLILLKDEGNLTPFLSVGRHFDL